ncbi:hypothetical protein [Methylobacterium flocculans]|uniref:hypothetical protein n=1 Tax=Methylobacterium flocculans TaxID=2984843 RepID=UPI0021F30E86|nr:hypothetical protein [Methylobacterium sp. FF17]
MANAADITVRLTSSDSETASVFLNGGTEKWSGTNGGAGDIIKSRSGKYKSGTNVVPGFAVKGTGLLVGESGANVEAFFYNLIPGEAQPGNSGVAHFLGTGKVGKWEVK